MATRTEGHEVNRERHGGKRHAEEHEANTSEQDSPAREHTAIEVDLVQETRRAEVAHELAALAEKEHAEDVSETEESSGITRKELLARHGEYVTLFEHKVLQKLSEEEIGSGKGLMDRAQRGLWRIGYSPPLRSLVFRGEDRSRLNARHVKLFTEQIEEERANWGAQGH